jgi:hypothetical protein
MKRFIAISLLIALTTPAQVIYFNHDESSFSATGNWASSDASVKAPLTETEIDCFKNGKMCVEATAEYYMGHPHVSVNYLDVIKWDKDGIIATDASGSCMTVTLQVSFADRRISSTHAVKQLDEETRKACKSFGAGETEEDIFVLKGSERWNKEHSFLPQKSEK